ncbi:binary toxin-like calcium binding domain-containing protein [Clostridium botulinum]|uniref:binary toxin-like calcium binding domain-containing protein n=1 Tax=Clostridium botulinum TaxID=1491 RepID=UPI0009475088|nr:binary toxin-like calcium binding domain-containing protein [Clostridium botulinum]APQ78432.1 clostridial binary toxin B/anthrax toxin PA family protein [Clostridium botulinum]MBN3353984.1 hypothetical protein [Clostridium botulinum]
MKKKIALLVACAVIGSSTLSVNNYSVKAKEKPAKKVISEVNKKVDRSGLFGYYYSEFDFANPKLFAPTRNGKLMFNVTSKDKGILTKNNSNYKSIKWFGYLKSDSTGDYKFKISDDKNAIIEVNKKIVSNKGEKKEVVHLKKGQPVEIIIEYQNKNGIKVGDEILTNMTLEKIDKSGKGIKVKQSELNNPEYDNQEKTHIVSRALNSSLSKDPKSKEINLQSSEDDADSDEDDADSDEDDKDSDNDAIPDNWEINGYTIDEDGKAVAWEDSLAEQRFEKFVSNPHDAHTVGDPYTDYEKAAAQVDGQSDPSTLNPLVAAYPIVNVGMENMYLSLNADMSHKVGSQSSHNWTYSNTEGGEVHVGFSAEQGISAGISANYSHTDTNGSEWGSSTDDTTSFNSAETTYFNANVRYNNVGTGAIYDVKPTTNFSINGQSFATITSESNTKALEIFSGDSYPKKGTPPIVLNTMDDFGGKPITLNLEQTNSILKGKTVRTDTTQTDGSYHKIDASGNSVMGDRWSTVTGEIESKTASIIVDTGDEAKERRVFAKNSKKPMQRKAPALTLREAIKISFPNEVTEKEGLLYYNDKPIFESAVMTYTDENTLKMIEKQINDKTGEFKDVHTIYDVKLKPEMNFTIKLAKYFDNCEDADHNKCYDSYLIDGGLSTGKKQRSVNGNGTSSHCYIPDDITEDDKEYYVSLYMKADGDTKATIELRNAHAGVVLNSKDVDLNNKGYQRIDIPVKSFKDCKLNRIYVKSDGGKTIYWDDVSITETSNVKVPDLFKSEQYVKSFYKDYSLIRVFANNDNYYNGVKFSGNMENITKHIPKYRIKCTGRDNFDVTRKSPDLNSDGTLTLNFLDFNAGKGLLWGNYITIYAINDYGDEFKIIESNI